MSVRPVDMIMLPQMTEVSQLKQQEHSRPIAEQATIVNQNDKQTEVKAEQVTQKDNADNGNAHYDARDKSNNEYQGNGKQKKKEEDGVVKIKGKAQPFDITI